MLLRTFALAILLWSVTVAGLAQVPGPDGHEVIFFNHAVGMPPIGPGEVPGQMPDDGIQKVKAALNLSDVQVTAVKSLQALRSQTHQQVFQEMREVHWKLQEVITQNNPNPTDVGNAFLATQRAQQRFREAAGKFQTDFQALLDVGQRSRLTNLHTASGQIEALRMLGVLDGPGPAIMPMPFPPIGPFSGAVGAVGGVAVPTPQFIERSIRIRRPDPSK